MGQRLAVVASGLARMVEFTVVDTITVEMLDPEIYTAFLEVQSEGDLANVVMMSPGGQTILDLAGYAAEGEPSPFIDLDFSAVELARSGLSAYTDLYQAGDVYMKGAYAPIRSTTGRIVALVGVEAGAAFFETLSDLSRAMIIFTTISAGVAIVLAASFFHQSRSLDRAHETMMRQEKPGRDGSGWWLTSPTRFATL